MILKGAALSAPDKRKGHDGARPSKQSYAGPIQASDGSFYGTCQRCRMKRRQVTRGIHLKNRARRAARAALDRCSVEVSVAGLDPSAELGTRSIASRKGMKRRHRARGIHLENRADPNRAALAGRSVEVSVAPLAEPVGIGRVRMELMKHLILLASRGGAKKRRCPDYKGSNQIPAFHNSLKSYQDAWTKNAEFGSRIFLHDGSIRLPARDCSATKLVIVIRNVCGRAIDPRSRQRRA
jgi:hypothetical protein